MRRIVVSILAAGTLALSGVGVAQAHDFRSPHDPHHFGHSVGWSSHWCGFFHRCGIHHPGFGFHPGHPGHFKGRH